MIATGLKDFLWHCVELLIATGLWLNVLLCSDSILRSGWESFPRIEGSLGRILLSDNYQWVQLHSQSRTGPLISLSSQFEYATSHSEQPQHSAAVLEGRPPCPP